GSKPGYVACFHQEACLPLDANLARAITIESNHRFPSGKSLRESAGQSFAQGEMNKEIHDPNYPGNLGWWNQASKDEMLLQSTLAGKVSKMLFQGTASDEQEFGFGKSANYLWSGGEEIVMAFQKNYPGKLPNHQFIGSDTIAGPERFVVFSAKKQLQGKPAENTGIFLRCADPRFQVLFRHRIGHG